MEQGKGTSAQALRRQQAEDELVRRAAIEIAAMDMEAFFAAQENIPDPPPEVMERLRRKIHARIRQEVARTRRKRFLRRAAQCAAAVVVIGSVGFTGTYFTVSAAREAINNFFLVSFDDHAVTRTEENERPSGTTVPGDWNEAITPTWVPERFDRVIVMEVGRGTSLTYDSSTAGDAMAISFWDASASPYVDTEDMILVDDLTIQNVRAELYYKETDGQYTLLMAKNDISMQIRGELEKEEIIKIAENISF